MPRIFKESDFADSSPTGGRTFNESDFISDKIASKPMNHWDKLLDGIGINASELQDQILSGYLERQGNPASSFVGKLGRLAGQITPEVGGAMLGGALGAAGGTATLPGIGTIGGATFGAGVGAAAGRSVQNMSQSVSNALSPGSASEKTPMQQIAGPIDAGMSQAAFSAGTGAMRDVIKEPLTQYVSGMTGVKPHLVRRTLARISDIFSSPSVEQAGEKMNAVAEKAGVKTGTEGYKLATGSMLGAKAATDEFSTATTMEMARLARDGGIGAMTPQEMYSTAEGLRKAISAPKFADPHGPFSQNFRMYVGQLAELQDELEKFIPGHGAARDIYANALAKEAFGHANPINKNGSVSQLKLMGGTPQALLGAAGVYEAYQGKSGPAEMLLGAALLSPLIMGKTLQAAALAGKTRLPQIIGRGAASIGGHSIADALSGSEGQ